MIHYEQLEARLADLIAEAETAIELYSPYIKAQPLIKLLRHKKKNVACKIITTWKIEDALFGASDPEVYDVAKGLGAQLFLNQRLHLKTYVFDRSSFLTGSANITQRALGLTPMPNHETLAYFSNPDLNYFSFLNQIQHDSKLVSQEIAENFSKLVKQAVKTTIYNSTDEAQKDFDLTLTNDSAFLISSLPMSPSIKTLFEVLNGKSRLSKVDLALAQHDISNFHLSDLKGQPFAQFKKSLSTRFFRHRFIAALCEFIDRPTRFGAIKEWVQSNCTNVPIPSRRTLTGNVQVLYEWLVELGEDRYIVSRPRHSQIISPRKASK